MKLLMAFVLSFAFCLVKSQSILGAWQITKETNCLEEEVTDTLQAGGEMLKEFNSKSSYSPKIIRFNEDNSGEESIKAMEQKKATSVKKFHYRFDGQSVHILDKKSHLLVDSWIIEKLTTDSLIYYVGGKGCERKFLVRLK